MECWVYVLECTKTSRFYVGSAQDVDVRLSEHNSGKVNSTRSFGPWAVVYRERHPDRTAAVKRERQIKLKKSRKWIEYHLLGRQ
jgi:putative endonuclease